MKELIESCKRAIKENRCIGCQNLENENFTGNINCKYNKIQSAEESIKQIKLNLQNGDKMKYEEMINTIILGNSYELIKNIPDNSIDLVYIDIPYLFNQSGGGGTFGENKKQYRKDLINIKNGIDYKILNDLVRVMKKINCFIWCSRLQIIDILNYFNKLNCNFNILVWCKTNPIPTANNMWLPDLEYCLYFRQAGVKLNDGYELKSQYFIQQINTKDKQKFIHPTIKPLELVKRHILHATNKNDVVLDCFSGSGTTCVAAKELKRNFIGIEIDEEYHKISLDRLNGILANGQISFDTLAERQKDEI